MHAWDGSMQYEKINIGIRVFALFLNLFLTIIMKKDKL
jgi:hypothetical protein